MAAWVKEEENTSEYRQAEEEKSGRGGQGLGGTWTDPRTPQAASTVPTDKPETLRVRSCRCYVFGCKCEIVAIQGGYRMARGWRYTKLSLSSALLLSFPLACALCFFSFLFVVLVLFQF